MDSSEHKPVCMCGEGDFIVLACSGSCDLGQVTDIVARRLRDNKVRKMSCLAAVGANLSKSIEAFKKANLLLLDGCYINCGRRILDNAGFNHYNMLTLTDLGYVKGETGVTEEVLAFVYDKVETIY